MSMTLTPQAREALRTELAMLMLEGALKLVRKEAREAAEKASLKQATHETESPEEPQS